MFYLVLSTLFIASGGGAQLGEADNCDPGELKVCVDLIPRTPIGLPKTRDELDLHCSNTLHIVPFILHAEFLKEPACWARVSPDWSRCVDELQGAVRDITDRAQQLTYFNRNAELCCARDAFIMCVAHAGRSCSASAGTLLRRMAWVLAQDVAACTQQPRATCAASPPPLAAPLLTALYGVVMYPPRL
ncbi:uncharacterized protein LOC114364303 [Ostrinia furnacalis]|uniref:uncharacterized protein LOC114364303 n=1 Tax=Ostrinia furnacalis TaxID=93504 RepID=UPI00103E1789|nr:uncharacterized protein LOC114364303 [Ostrinia furnacalis]